MKKHILVLFISLLFKSISIGQVYQPLPMQNSFWRYYGGVDLLSCPACIPVNYTYQTAGDTIIGAFTYVKITKTEQPSVNDESVFPTYTGAIRQDTLNKKIFIVLKDSIGEGILYDFSLQVGDTVISILHDLASDCSGFNIETVASIDSILVNGNYHRRLQIQGSCYPSSQLYYIEGIGSTFGLIFPNRMDQKESHLECTSVNGLTYYPDSTANCLSVITSDEDAQGYANLISIFPNPTSTNIRVDFQSQRFLNNGKISLVSADGRLIYKNDLRIKEGYNSNLIELETVPSGVYFLEISAEDFVARSRFMVIR